MQQRPLPLAARAIVMAGAYLIAARIGLELRAQPDGIAIFWPPSGILLAALVLHPRRNWPIFLAAYGVVAFASDVFEGRGPFVALGYMVANGVEGLVGALVMHRLAPKGTSRLRSVLVFVVPVAAAAAVVSAALGALTTVLSQPELNYASVFVRWSEAVFVGIVIVAPPILAWAALPPLAALASKARLAEAGALSLAVILSAVLTFSGSSTMASTALLALPFPVLAWAALRFGRAGSALSSLVFVTIATWLTAHGQGAFGVGGDAAERLRWAQLYFVVLAVTPLMLAAVDSDRRRAEDELRQSRERLLHAQKLESVGRLAGGVAHDFNNLLTVLRGEAELARDHLSPESPVHLRLDAIVDTSARGASLTSQLLAFARRKSELPQVVSLRDIVRESASLVQRLHREDIDVRVAAGSQACTVRADPSQLQQVLLNLVINALDAMPSGGRLDIGVAEVQVPGPEAERLGLAQDGAYVELVVRDEGVGMSEPVRQRAFEPFFTTKPIGRGTGLGLATCHGIVTAAKGAMEITSAPGQGTAVRVVLPRAVGETRAEPAARPETPELPGRAAVLLVEDDEAVRRLLSEALVRAGCTVTSVPNAEAALDVIARRGSGLEAIVSDVVLPGLSGAELAHRARALHAELPIVLMSGHADDVLASKSPPPPGVRVLAKPLSPSELVAAVHDAISRRARATS